MPQIPGKRAAKIQTKNGRDAPPSKSIKGPHPPKTKSVANVTQQARYLNLAHPTLHPLLFLLIIHSAITAQHPTNNPSTSITTQTSIITTHQPQLNYNGSYQADCP
jgi:hypothetical protein